MSGRSLARRAFVVATASAATTLVGCSSGRRERASSTTAGTNAALAGATPSVTAVYRARLTEIDLAGQVVRTVTYDGSLPGKVLRAREGDVVDIVVHNETAEATSVHWHGLAIVNSMDGVPGVTQPDIAPGGTFTYRFVVPDGGT